jgi:hypothetical protein
MTEIAAWQRGFDLDRLRQLKALFARYKPYAYGRFSIPNEAAIAELLDKQQASLLMLDEEQPLGISISRIASRDSYRQDFAGRKFKIHKGDVVFSHITWIDEIPEQSVEDLLAIAGNRSCWAEIHTEDRPRIQALQRRGFETVGSRIGASSEMTTIMLRSNRPALRLPAPLAAHDQATLTQLSKRTITEEEIAQILAEIVAHQPEWANHYSSYNEGKSWSAISLRGFSPNPSFIIKPSEMSKKWKQENAALLSSPVISTPAWQALPTIREVLARLGMSEGETQRVRLMRVRAGDGRLTRHADITDPEAGAAVGSIARLHIPIVSDPTCRFHAWGLDGSEMTAHLPTGSLWYLDTRKPHAVSNIGSPNDRIHLVVDAIVSPSLSSWIAEASGFPLPR